MVSTMRLRIALCITWIFTVTVIFLNFYELQRPCHSDGPVWDSLINTGAQPIEPERLIEKSEMQCPPCEQANHSAQPAGVDAVQSLISKDVNKEDVSEDNEFKVPNIVHFIWYSPTAKPLEFHQMLSIFSAYKTLKPDVMYFHTNLPPYGENWNQVKDLPTFKVNNRRPPSELFGEQIKDPVFYTSHSNVDRLKILQEYGGIYLDLDILVTKSFDELRKYDCTIGLESDDQVCNSVIVCSKNSPFLLLWLNSFLDDYKVQEWSYNSGKVPYKFSLRYPQLVHVESNTINRPNFKELNKIWGSEAFEWRNNYAVHLWYRVWKTMGPQSGDDPSAKSIMDMSNTFSRIAYDILYGPEGAFVNDRMQMQSEETESEKIVEQLINAELNSDKVVGDNDIEPERMEKEGKENLPEKETSKLLNDIMGEGFLKVNNGADSDIKLINDDEEGKSDEKPVLNILKPLAENVNRVQESVDVKPQVDGNQNEYKETDNDDEREGAGDMEGEVKEKEDNENLDISEDLNIEGDVRGNNGDKLLDIDEDIDIPGKPDETKATVDVSEDVDDNKGPIEDQPENEQQPDDTKLTILKPEISPSSEVKAPVEAETKEGIARVTESDVQNSQLGDAENKEEIIPNDNRDQDVVKQSEEQPYVNSEEVKKIIDRYQKPPQSVDLLKHAPAQPNMPQREGRKMHQGVELRGFDMLNPIESDSTKMKPQPSQENAQASGPRRHAIPLSVRNEQIQNRAIKVVSLQKPSQTRLSVLQPKPLVQTETNPQSQLHYKLQNKDPQFAPILSPVSNLAAQVQPIAAQEGHNPVQGTAKQVPPQVYMAPVQKVTRNRGMASVNEMPQAPANHIYNQVKLNQAVRKLPVEPPKAPLLNLPQAGAAPYHSPGDSKTFTSKESYLKHLQADKQRQEHLLNVMYQASVVNDKGIRPILTGKGSNSFRDLKLDPVKPQDSIGGDSNGVGVVKVWEEPSIKTGEIKAQNTEGDSPGLSLEEQINKEAIGGVDNGK